MKTLQQYIEEKLVIIPSQVNEKLVINKNYTDAYNYHPKNKKELKAAIEEHYANDIYDLNDIDVSNITHFNYMFYGDENTENKDFDVSKWDVSNGEDFSWMFYECTKFNSDLGDWNISNGKDFRYMFNGCKDFNHDLTGWKINKKAKTDGMFFYCHIDNKYKPKGVE